MANLPWSEEEIDLIVEDYLSMLVMELRGEAFNKSAHRRDLQKQLNGRTEASIEMKHQNISSVMEVLSLPSIRGYKPLPNIQRALLDRVDRKISCFRWDELVPRLDEPLRLVDALQMVPGPAVAQEIGDPAHGLSQEVRNIVEAHNPAARDARNRALGEAGERAVFQFEQGRLSEQGRDDLANQVRWVSKDDGDGRGYDILSFTREGKERWLEVKTTCGHARTRFWISANECRVAESNPVKYRVARVFKLKHKPPQRFDLHPPLNRFVNLIPENYRAEFR